MKEVKHRTYGEGWQISYWKGHTASDRDDADRACLEVSAARYPTFDFTLPAQQHELEKMITAFQKVSKTGYLNCKKELRDWLGVCEA